MKYDDSASVGDVGEAAVALIVARDLKWICRKVPPPDRGIDAIVEEVRGRRATGRWLSLQIKSGESYFRESTYEGVVYRSSSKDHLAYYRQHQLPVAMVLYYADPDVAFWQWVTDDAVVETAKGWTLLLPHDQQLCADTVAPWAARLRPRSSAAIPGDLRTVARFGNGALSTIHDLLGGVERELVVSAPFLPVDLLTLLDFVASRARGRFVTSYATLDQPLLKAIGPAGRLEIRLMESLHLKAIVADREVASITSANFSRMGGPTECEVLATVTSPDVVEAVVQQFEELWSHATYLPSTTG